VKPKDRPSEAEAAALASGAGIIPISREIPADLLTPVAAFLAAASRERNSFLLESVEGGEALGRYSFLGWRPRFTIRARGREIVESGPGSKRKLQGNVFEILRRRLVEARPAQVPGLPRLTSGAVGFIGYDAVRLLESIPDGRHDELGMDDVVFGFYDRLAAFDHVRRRLLLTTLLRAEGPKEARRKYRGAVRDLDEMEAALARPVPRRPARSPRSASGFRVVSGASREEFEKNVRAAKSLIRSGDIFQVVLSQRFETDLPGTPFDVYRALRRINPSPYMYCLIDGDDAIVGASPEMLVRVEGDRVETRPIAGTRGRGATEEEDRALEASLLADAKERAEHLMLVDLSRNDLGRVATPGSIEVKDLMSVERYSHVMHMVTRVRGRLRPGLDAVDALTACFPAGTVSGAPKVRAMEIIEELEESRRGPYGGAIAYADGSGNLDSCITIRTMVSRGRRAFVQAGAGIVADSDPAAEYDETRRKAAALLAAIGDGEGR
jgi:anthranilate synthase component 1